jgi:uncharacterized protein (TIGR02145 family)
MRKVIIFLGMLFAFSVAQAQVADTDSLNRGVNRTGKARNGCDCDEGQVFETPRGQDTIAPRVARTGKRLAIEAKVSDSIPGCGTTDEEALVDITVKWTGNYISKITHCGVKYYKVQGSGSGEDCDGDTGLKTIDSTVALCGDFTIRLMLDSLCPGSTYIITAYVVTMAGDKKEAGELILTKKRNRCGGWKANPAWEQTINDSIILVKDIDTNKYGVIQIGKQCWLRENMRCNQSPNRHILHADSVNYNETRGIYYQVSDEIPYYYRYDASNLSFRQRGNIYNWPAVVDTTDRVTELPPGVRRGICPEGWHVPNVYEWYEMIKFSLVEVPELEVYLNNHTFYGDSVVRMSFGCDWPMSSFNDYPGGFMNDPSHRNGTGFAALPANNVQLDGSLGYVSQQTGEFINVANFWLSSWKENSSTDSYSWHIDDNRGGVSAYSRPRKRGFSVRCIRDQLTIAVNPSDGKFCVPSVVTYTPKVAQEDTSKYDFYWSVFLKKGKADSLITKDVVANPFVFDHTKEGVQKIICRAKKIGADPATDPTADLMDSIFVTGTGTCTIIKANPSSSTVCAGETVTFTAQVPGVNLTNYNIKWKVNDKDLGNPELNDLSISAQDTSLTCTFPLLDHESSYTISVQLVPRPEVPSLSPDVDTLKILVSNKLPSLTVCSDCDAEGFVIKKSQITYGNNVAQSSVIWRDNNHNAISYQRKENDTVKLSVYNGPYSIEMTSSVGCRDTMRNMVLKPSKFGCKIMGTRQHDTVEQGPTSDSIYYVLDHEHNRYSTIQVGLNRCWMKENLRTTTSPSHPSMYFVVKKKVDQPYTSRLACWYNYDSVANSRYGLLYNWCAAADTANEGSSDPWDCSLPVNHRGICPMGWHLPTNQEWVELETYLNGDENSTFSADTIADMLSGGCSWKPSTVNNAPGNYHGTDWATSGFTVMPAGQFTVTDGIVADGIIKMNNFSTSAKFWTASQGNSKRQALYHGLDYDKPNVSHSDLDKSMGVSVRCVRDIPQMVINHRTLENCTNQMVASISSSNASDYHFVWKINNVTQSSHTYDMEFAYEKAISQYHIVCLAMLPRTDGSQTYDTVFKDSTDIQLQYWPPSISTCIDETAGSIKITSTSNVNTAVWLDSNDQQISTATSGYVSSEQLNGRYAVRMYNKQGACSSDTVTVVLRPATYCIVAAKNDAVEVGPSDNPDRVDSIYDAAGNAYPVVQIGSHCWMKTNMRTELSSNGSPLTFGNIQSSCSNGDVNNDAPRYYDYCASATLPLEQRGYFYNWSAASQICPSGWKLPSTQEWNELMSMAVYSAALAGGCEWKSSSGNNAGNRSAVNRNATGFSIVPAGNLESDGGFKYRTERARFWTSNAENTNAYRMSFEYSTSTMNTLLVNQNLGYSVRCVRDIPNLTNQCFKSHNNNEILSPNNPSLIDSVESKGGLWNYGVVQIGGYCWLRENLRDTIGLVNGMESDVKGKVDGNVAYYYTFNTLNSIIPLKERGYFYNWKAATNSICPDGWHLPTKNEWNALAAQAESIDMLAGTDYWTLESGVTVSSAQTGCPYFCNTASAPGNCNILGFTLVPAGNMQLDGTLGYVRNAANLWASDDISGNNRNYAIFDAHKKDMRTDTRPKSRGFSVRCLRDY